LRLAMLGRDGRVRSRRTFEPWTGIPSVLRIFDGNPRLFLSFLNSVLTPLADLEPISRQDQAQALKAVIEDFVGLLGRIVVSDPQKPPGLLDLLDRVGGAQRRLFYGPFNPDPVLSFVVDERISVTNVQLLQAGLNAGALVEVEPGRGPHNELRGARLRLTYLLAPRYGLPPLLGRSASLSTLLTTQSRNPPPSPA
jgi:hypothetical protein